MLRWFGKPIGQCVGRNVTNRVRLVQRCASLCTYTRFDSLADPSYVRQLLVLTYPMIGNYGVPDHTALDEHGISKHFESDKIHVAALIVDELCSNYSHWNAVQSLSEWMNQQGVPGISGVDTRALTKKLRTSGSMAAKIVIDVSLCSDMAR